MTVAGLKLCGYAGLVNDQRGQFQANWADSNHARRIPGDLPRPFLERLGMPGRVYELYRRVVEALAEELVKTGYLGPVGIDAFIYRTSEGELRLKPVVEINPRYTMGRLTLEMMKHTCPGSIGVFSLLSLATVRSEGFDGFREYARALASRGPLRLEGSPVPRIREGALCLNDPAEAREYLAVFRVGRSFDEVATAGEALAGKKLWRG